MDTDKLLESVEPLDLGSTDTRSHSNRARSGSDRARADASIETIFVLLIVGLGATLISFGVLTTF